MAASLDGVNPALANAITQTMNECSGSSIASGKRSTEEQAVLYQKYLNGTGNLAAPPGSSNHETGNAVDINGNYSCIHSVGAKYGLVFPVAGEPWHAELGSGAAQAAMANPASNPAPKKMDMETALATAVSAITGEPAKIEDATIDVPEPDESPAAAYSAGGSGDWVADVLAGIGAPVTDENRRFMETWQRFEGGHTHNTATFNWLNTTMSGGTPMNSVGVQAYADYQTGVQKTVDTLLLGHYTGIVAALRQGTDARAAAQALANSPWGTGAAVLGAI